MAIDIRFFGGFLVSDGGEPVTARLADNALNVLAELAGALYRSEMARREEIALRIWGDRERGLVSLSTELTNLRRLLGASAIQSMGRHFLWLDEPSLSTDVGRFKAFSVEARQSNGPDTTAALKEAVKLYHGPFLPELGGERLDRYRDQFEGDYCDLVDQLVDSVIGLKQTVHWNLAHEHAKRVVDRHPYRQQTHLRIMRLLVLAGDGTGALSHYHAVLHALDREGLRPSPYLAWLAHGGSEGRSQLYPTPSNEVGQRNGERPRRSAPTKRMDEPVLIGDDEVITLSGPNGLGRCRLALRFEPLKGEAFRYRVQFVADDLIPDSARKRRNILTFDRRGTAPSINLFDDLRVFQDGRELLNEDFNSYPHGTTAVPTLTNIWSGKGGYVSRNFDAGSDPDGGCWVNEARPSWNRADGVPVSIPQEYAGEIRIEAKVCVPDPNKGVHLGLVFPMGIVAANPAMLILASGWDTFDAKPRVICQDRRIGVFTPGAWHAIVIVCRYADHTVSVWLDDLLLGTDLPMTIHPEYGYAASYAHFSGFNFSRLSEEIDSALPPGETLIGIEPR